MAANDTFFSSQLVPSSIVVGTATNDNAVTGYLGEVVESIIASGSEVSLSNATAKTITSISLTAGDWEVSGSVGFLPAGTTTITFLAAGTSTTTNALAANSQSSPVSNQLTSYFSCASFTPGNLIFSNNIPSYRVSLSSTTTLFLVGQANFGTSTLTARGYIHARRVR